MSPLPAMAVVIEGGLAQSILVEDWPASIPLPRIVIVDYDIEGADELTEFFIGGTPTRARCHLEIPEVYESSETLSPHAVLKALGEPAGACPGLLSES